MLRLVLRLRSICALILPLIPTAFRLVSAQQTVEPWKAPHFSIEPETLYDAATASDCA